MLLDWLSLTERVCPSHRETDLAEAKRQGINARELSHYFIMNPKQEGNLLLLIQ